MLRIARRILTTALLATIVLPASAAPRVRSVKAGLMDPVVEELMGGCSLACAFAWSVQSARPGVKLKPVPQLNDESAQTAWLEPAVGARLNFVFPAKLRPELERTPVYGFNMINGLWKDEAGWESHARVKRARVLYNDRPYAEIVFPDSRRWLEVFFGDIYVRSGDRMALEILEVYPGSGATRNVVAISEISLQGAH